MNIEHQIVMILYKYIDRLQDPVTSDPLEKIVPQFLKEVHPIIELHLKCKEIS